ncbi:hypothetical protein KM176_00915 [Pseudooceanicola sp. CBS1P-1]|uniref:Uncharacterized protein n=1 Tax=Pseudooceanicola albus TaxID=2692189 RepID=A0A6L7FZ56_9RHOB|nr:MULTISPECIES: hypothetical protein [Pseudooceanicola]MBT9382408.1 hypothetical protein [Pseudooceanicola endophyticus]MXN16949.1 hypothetical protein [Pseudooceanicola albus]
MKIERSMLGIVLWVAEESRTAVVWCEDQGDLVNLELCREATGTGQSLVRGGLGAGDLVQFDLFVMDHQRVGRNARAVPGGHSPQVLRQLRAAGAAQADAADPAAPCRIAPRAEKPAEGMACASARSRWNLAAGERVLIC